MPLKILPCTALILIPGLALADAGSLFRASPVGAGPQSSSALVSMTARAPLLIERSAGNLLLAPPAPGQSLKSRGPHGLSGPQVERLRHLIEQAESRRMRYDAVQHGARIPPPARPTRMTLAEIFRWIDETPGQPHAIGRYQFIPATLRRLVAHLDVPHNAVFSPQLQDRLADVLLVEAGFHAVEAQRMDRRTFMHNLARIWAGLPLPTGRSYYHGYAGNKATMTWARFEAEMARIFPG